MSDTNDYLVTIINAAESAAGKWLVARVIAGMGIAAGSMWLGPVTYVVTLAVGIIVTYGDVLAFMLVSEWHDTAEGKAFEQASNALQHLPDDADESEREDAELAQMAAFAALVALGK